MLASWLPLHATDTARQLAPYYREWPEQQVPYIISTDERKAYLALHSDVERDNFIAAFWEARNPTPGTGYNSYKEEYFRRLTYASEHFGSMRYHDGWRTEQGRIYITLGPPRSTQTYHLTANIRDLEIWFYQAETPALPSFFNIVFFRPGVGEDYKIYSPRSDGPYRLVTTGQQDNKAAMRIIRQQLGPELAHAALSLIPSEPVDSDDASPSIDSEVMLSKIFHLADDPLEKARISAAHAKEAASAGIVVSGPAQDLESAVFRDARGRLTLSYLLREHEANPALVGRLKQGGEGYSLALRTSLFSDTGKAIYEQQNTLQGTLNPAQVTTARTRDFAAEDRLPILPGQYRLEVALRNNLTGLETLFHGQVTVPDAPAGSVTLSPLVVYSGAAPIRDEARALPFSIAGLRFAPRSAGTATIHRGDSLPLVFQLHLPAPAAGKPRPASVHLHYVFGAVTGSAVAPSELEEDLPTESADPAGNILNGHTLPTFDLLPGVYRVVVRATAGEALLATSSALQLRVLPVTAPVGVWTAYGPEPAEVLQQDDVKRGMVAAAQGHPEQAELWFSGALREFAQDARALNLLALTLAGEKKTAALASLGEQPQFSHAVDPDTTVLVADALDTSGSGARAVALLNAQVALQPPSAALLHALSRCYGHMGKSADAQAFAKKAEALAHP